MSSYDVDRSYARTVFGRGKSAAVSPESSFSRNGALGIFRTTEADKRPARQVVTARLMGDPAPDRVQPDIPRSIHEIRTHWSQPLPTAPINLTFAQLRQQQA